MELLHKKIEDGEYSSDETIATQTFKKHLLKM